MNALSLAKLGIGFGAIAVAAIGLIPSQHTPTTHPNRPGSSARAIIRTVPRDPFDTDDDEWLIFNLIA